MGGIQPLLNPHSYTYKGDPWSRHPLSCCSLHRFFSLTCPPLQIRITNVLVFLDHGPSCPPSSLTYRWPEVTKVRQLDHWWWILLPMKRFLLGRPLWCLPTLTLCIFPYLKEKVMHVPFNVLSLHLFYLAIIRITVLLCTWNSSLSSLIIYILGQA